MPVRCSQPASYSELIKRAAQDGVLTLKIGQRNDLSGEHLKELLDGTLDVIRRRLSSVVNPMRQVEIKRAMASIEEAALPPGPRRDFSAAQRTVLDLHQGGHLGESALLGFAKAHKYEESIASLSTMSGVRALDPRPPDRGRPLRSDSDPGARAESRLAHGARAHPDVVRTASHAGRCRLEAARMNFTRLMPATAERVVNFWRNRQTI